MRKAILITILSRLASEHGQKIVRNIGQSSVSSLTRLAHKRGLLDRTYDLETLTQELKRMYQNGQFSRLEWSQISAKLKQLWRQHNK